MAQDNVKFVCGCGFRTTDREEATGHCDEKKHTLFATGEIKKDEVKKIHYSE